MDVLAIVDRKKPDGVIVQLGGQTPSRCRRPGEGRCPLSHDPDSTTGQRPQALSQLVRILPAAAGQWHAVDVDGRSRLPTASLPGLVPRATSWGRAMEIVYDDASLVHYMERALGVTGTSGAD